MRDLQFSEITPEVLKLSRMCTDTSQIEQELYYKYDVKRGLRDLNGKGVLAGLTEISEICSKELIDGQEVPCRGRLYYRGHDIKDLVHGFTSENRFGYEEITYLLLFGRLPNRYELMEFTELLSDYRATLPSGFVRDIIMKAPSHNMMNTLSRSVLTLYSYDDRADDISIPNVLRQCLQLISIFPLLSVYGYQTAQHYYNGKSLYIHSPQPELSAAQNILHILRKDGSYTDLEARILDLALVLHMDYGGGNNSTFTTHVVSSSGTDTYSSMAAALGSLKGPRHGGANCKVAEMFEDLKENVRDWEDEDEIKHYLRAILNKEAFDHSGLIYGLGHAVYSLSDPRAELFKTFAQKLSVEKHREEDYNLCDRVERLAPEVIAEERHIYKGVSANVDYYSGFVYQMMGLPIELYTPIFAMARIVGWSAHRIEELANNGKIIRPAYRSVCPHTVYRPMAER